MLLRVTLVCIFVQVALARPSKRGACAVACSPGTDLFDSLGLNDCPQGYECRSTGCGALCYRTDKNAAVVSGSKRGTCAISCSPGVGIFDDLNLAECPTGYMCRSTGCGAMCFHL